MSELRKTCVPEGTLRVEIDDPQDHRLKEPVGVLRGWLTTRDSEVPETFHFQLGGITLPHSLVSREDVGETLPDHTIVGFEIPYDLCSYLPYIQDNRLSIRMILPGYDRLLFRFQIAENALAICMASAGGV